MVDTGAGLSAPDVRRALEKSGLQPEDLTGVLLTHAHGDHAGGAAELLAEGVPVVFGGAATARALATGDEHRTGVARAREAGIYPADFRLGALPVQPLSDSECLDFDDLRVRAIATPGHSADHFSFSIETGSRSYLLAGDAVFWGGKILLQDLPDVSLSDCAASCRRLAAEHFDALLPGHGMLALTDADKHLESAAATFEVGRVPANLV